MIEKFMIIIKWKKAVFQRSFFALIFNFYLIFSLQGQTSMSVNGNWNYTVSPVIEAGNDFSLFYTSAPDQVYLSADKNKAKGNFKWSFSIHKEDVLWDNTMRLFVKRTGNGTNTSNGNGGGLIQGGTAFQEINNTDNFFFSGKKGRVDIPVQYQIQGLSVLIPADNYSTNIVYTLREE